MMSGTVKGKTRNTNHDSKNSQILPSFIESRRHVARQFYFRRSSTEKWNIHDGEIGHYCKYLHINSWKKVFSGIEPDLKFNANFLVDTRL